jgi:hypothetical protein
MLARDEGYEEALIYLEAAKRADNVRHALRRAQKTAADA